MNKKSILIISLSTFTYDARVKTYAKYLKEKGYDVVIVSSKEKDDEPSEIRNEFINYRIIKKYQGGSGLSYILYYLKFLLVCFIKVSGLSFKTKFDLVHYNNAPNFIIFSALIPKIRGAKIVLDNHDIFPHVFSSKFNSRFLYKLALLEQTVSMKFADKIICADHNQKDYLIEEKIPSEKITVVLNTPNPNFFKRKVEMSPNSKIKMIYHGTISERLGIDNILKAIKLVKPHLNDFQFHLIGTGDFLDKVKQLHKELELGELVNTYEKNIPVEELSHYLQKMDIGIIANRVTTLSDYMLPVKLLEYVYSGIPVIAPYNSILERYFTKDMLCFYTPENVEEMAEKILFLYKNPHARKLYAEKALDFMKQYNYETEMEKYQHVINQLIHRN